MRALLVIVIAALMACVAFAQLSYDMLPSNAVCGPIEIVTAAGDSVGFGAETINSKAVNPSGLILMATGPFRYKAKFPWGNDTAISVSVDTAISDTRGDVKYSVVTTVPGATWATISAITASDTVFVRPYYIVK